MYRVKGSATGTNPKPKSKKEGLLRVRALAIVLAVLERRSIALAVRDLHAVPLATLAPAAPPMPQLSPFPLLEPVIEVFRASLGSFGPSGEVEQPVAPVGLDAL